MPRKPKRPCSYPGCPNLTDGRFCPEHEKMEAKRYERTTEIQIPSVATDVHGNVSVTAMLLPIPFVRGALRMVSTHQPSKYTM